MELKELVKEKFQEANNPNLRKYEGVLVTQILCEKYIKELENCDLDLSVKLESMKIICDNRSITN